MGRPGHSVHLGSLLGGDRRAYQPRAAERGVLHAIIREHLETFLGEAAHRAEGAPHATRLRA